MVKKVIWVLVCCLMALSLVIASCGNGGTESSDGDTTSTPGDEEEVVSTSPDTPKYGGTFTRIRLTDPMGWDYAVSRDMFTQMMMGEELLGGDWKRGPAGSGENDWTGGFGGFINQLTGKLAESWEMPDNETLLYHIRPGIHWWDKAPANGRELLAEDIAWNIMRHFTETNAYLYNSYVALGKGPTSATALDKYTVEVKVPSEWQGLMATVVGDFVWSLCPDVVEMYGDSNDPNNFIGTGAYMFKDYKEASSIEYVKNPNYWQNDPLNPENQLPYMNGIKELIIADKSTQLAAFRTGQIDMMSFGLTWEDKDLLLEQFPEMLVKATPSASITLIWPRLDMNLPFDDIKVRQAMNMAINQQEILDDYYNGNADMLGWPYADLPVFSPIYTPLDEQPQIVQDMFGYNVEKAKELMVEAGYPDGFKCKVDASAAVSDFLSIIKNYLEDIGVEMELSNLEEGVYWSVRQAGTYESMIWSNDYVGNAFRMMCMTKGSVWNYSRFEHPKTEEAVKTVSASLGKDDALVAKTLKEIGPFELEQAVPIYLPSPHVFTMWWPWYQNFYGATGGGGYSNLDEYIQYTWIDTAMKADMGY
jgi:peptide/nickel transport system substrate-binding protein